MSLEFLIETLECQAAEWSDTDQARFVRSSLRGSPPAVTIAVLAIVFVERRFRSRVIRVCEYFCLATNLLASSLVQRIPIRNVTVGIAQVGIVHHPLVAHEHGWSRDLHQLSASLKRQLAWSLMTDRTWEMPAAARLVAATAMCHGHRALGEALSAVYNPWEPHYALLISAALRGLSATRPTASQDDQCAF
jgi:hypothetical protein